VRTPEILKGIRNSYNNSNTTVPLTDSIEPTITDPSRLTYLYLTLIFKIKKNPVITDTYMDSN